MQRPPDRPGPTILSSRPPYEWINRVGRKHREFTALAISDEKKELLKGWAEAEFAFNTLVLEGANVSRERAGRLAARSEIDLLGLSEEELLIASLVESLRTLRSLIEEKGQEAMLTPDILIRLRNPLGTPEGLRTGPGTAVGGLRPPAPARVPAAIESACRWFAAESITELNPIEQSALALLRLTEIQPFEQQTERAALAAASLFTCRAGLQPVIIWPDLISAYRAAIHEGLRMNTGAMVEVIAQSIEKSIDSMIEQAKN
jgi:hypothetical protein